MKKRYYKLRQKARAEDGQSMIEFVFVLPVFMLLLVMILDFGWLFYTQLGVENSARNAARVACVEYTRVAYDSVSQTPEVSADTAYAKVYKLADYQSVLNGTADQDDIANSGLSDQEIDILSQVSATVPSNFTDVSVSVAYSEDKKNLTEASPQPYPASKRSEGDVTIIVSGIHHAISPLVNWDAKPGESRMTRNLRCKSVYKVEANGDVNQDYN